MTELAAQIDQDPMLHEMQEARAFFDAEFGLEFDDAGQFVQEPTTEQLDALADWRRQTFIKGIEMPDRPTFVRKVLLAQALMPQRDEQGNVTYLFGKGCGAEISMQGQVQGREKLLNDVPYRTHADFEIYNFNQAEPPRSYAAFKHVFGGQETYPATETKALKDLPDDYLSQTAEEVNLGGVTLLVPKLEAQFVDKVEKRSEATERRLRDHTDAEWLAATYDLDVPTVHDLIEHHVIEPARAAFNPERQLTRVRRNAVMLGAENVGRMTVAIDPGNGFVLADHGLGAELLDMDQGRAISMLTEIAEQQLATKHIAADQELLAGSTIRQKL